jgi:hypothetical protein
VKFRHLPFGFVALAVLGFVGTGVAPEQRRAAAATDVAQVGSTPAPASPGPRRGRRAPGSPGPSPGANPTESAEPLQFNSLDGIWEVELQPVGRRTVYSHLNIVQSQNQLSGYWEHEPNRTRSPIAGSFDGRLFQITIDLGSGQSATMVGYAENFADFVGLLRMSPSDIGTPFTAQHRKKERPQ